MKIYRQSFWRTPCVIGVFFPFAPIAFLLLLLYCDTWHQKAISGFFLILFSTLLFAWLSLYCYVTITPKQLIIKNPFLPIPLFNKAYFYSDIEKIELEHPGGISPVHMLVFVTGKRRRRFPIDLVNHKAYPSLIKDLEEKGVNVEAVKL